MTANETILACAECGALSPPGAHGWRALLGYDLREDEQPEAFTFCLGGIRTRATALKGP